MINLENIRTNIQDAINQSGISQTELANKLGLKQPSVRQYLFGRSMPALDTFAKLCKILDLDANEILCIK